jgi:hypothetical protein
MSDRPRTVCLDFDDTLCAHDDSPMPGTREALAELKSRGVRLVVSSARFSPIYGELNAIRVGNVQAWLDGEGIEVDAVSIEVPDADLYVDDRAWRWTSWETDLPPLRDLVYPDWRSHKKGRRAKGKLSVSLDALWQDDAAAPGAEAAFRELACLDVNVVVSAGSQLGAESPRDVRVRLRAAKLQIGRVETGKVAAEVYVNPRGYRFGGDWGPALPEVLELLGES